MMRRVIRRGFCWVGWVLALHVLIAEAWAEDAPVLPDYVIAEFGHPPPVPDGPLAPDAAAALDRLVAITLDQANWDPADRGAFDALGAAQDPRTGWAIIDMMRFSWRPEVNRALKDSARAVLALDLTGAEHRAEITDHLLAWDVPAYPGYLAHKRAVYTNYIPRMDQIFVPGDIDWHQVSWGGVNIDDRPYDQTDALCPCIPAIDNPTVMSADDATWLAEDDIVFGVSVNGEFRAYPRRIMEVREMVNDTLGGRDLGIPYCTLCGAAQAFFTDRMPDGVERPILRTSGLLIRSNKVMFDLNTYSLFDTFLGRAVTGPLGEAGLVLEPASVITTDWGTWRAEHPETTVLTEDLALGRDYDFRNTRDANGPIFPVGDVDPRLPVHEEVLGVVTTSGTAVAFPRGVALAALGSGAEVGFEDVRLVIEAGGLRAVDTEGRDLGSHQAFWFAWSQFHPDTVLWPE